ncbi:hypothetical protein RMATCC62417_09854 [Rhizopus microsporus]|nr:hypothetical protein RMATCC62417_09854 [Rhizopus microsporus]
MSVPLLPKLKLMLSGKATLPAGDHVIPWEMDIPNIYPRSLLTKRASITYKVILSISTGLTKVITTEYPIIIYRHLLPYKELAPIIETKITQRTIPGKFHYEIDAPQIICLEQEFVPMAIKYVSFTNHRHVQSIRTRLVQIEFYRRQSPSKSQTDLSSYNVDSLVFDLDQKLVQSRYLKDSHTKYIKRTIPALIHFPDPKISAWKRPFLIRHRIHPYLSCTIESPLVSIYHQIEVTFQFGMKHEEVKAKIPIIIASVPKKEPSFSDSSMMRYAFEEVAQSDYLPYQRETRSSADQITDEETQDEHFSVLRDNCMMPATSDDDDDEATQNVVATAKTLLKPTYTTTHSPQCQSSLAQRALSPTMDSSTLLVNRSIKKFASAFDLSSGTTSRELRSPEPQELPEERPRTATPTMKRQHIYRRMLSPINVDLANGKLGVLQQMPPNDEGYQAHTTEPNSIASSPSSDVLPPLDRVNQSSTRLQRDALGSTIMPAQDMNENFSNDYNVATSSNRKHIKELGEDDAKSIYSDTSSINAPSLSSSATLSTNKSHPTLHSRPPSPVFSPAPGLPATIPLRSQDFQASQVEETFADAAMSPAMNTIASSTLLTPRTSYALRRRIALSTISSLTSDSFQLGPSMMASRGRSLSQATVDPEVQSAFMMSSCYSGTTNSDYYAIPRSHNSTELRYSSLTQRYMNAALPPIPNSVTINKRLTKIYLEDSDDESFGDIDELPSRSIPPPPPPPQDDHAPPRLPRLSFGKDLSISLGLNN